MTAIVLAIIGVLLALGGMSLMAAGGMGWCDTSPEDYIAGGDAFDTIRLGRWVIFAAIVCWVLAGLLA